MGFLTSLEAFLQGLFSTRSSRPIGLTRLGQEDRPDICDEPQAWHQLWKPSYTSSKFKTRITKKTLSQAAPAFAYAPRSGHTSPFLNTGAR